MRISDWSSDVCSSDLGDAAAVDRDMAMADELARGEHGGDHLHAIDHGVEPALQQADQVLRGIAAATVRLGIGAEIGRASGRGRVGKYGEITVGRVYLTKKRYRKMKSKRESRR